MRSRLQQNRSWKNVYVNVLSLVIALSRGERSFEKSTYSFLEYSVNQLNKWAMQIG